MTLKSLNSSPAVKFGTHHILLERKQTSGGLVSGVLQELNVKFYLFQKVLATRYSKFDKRHTPNLCQ